MTRCRIATCSPIQPAGRKSSSLRICRQTCRCSLTPSRTQSTPRSMMMTDMQTITEQLERHRNAFWMQVKRCLVMVLVGVAALASRVGDARGQCEVAMLIASDDASLDDYGSSVSISGDTAVIGAPLDDDAGIDSGSAYVFRRDDNGTPGDPSDDSWSEEAKFTASDPAMDDEFGSSVSISGDTAVIGAPQDDDSGSRSGSAFVFRRNDNGTPEYPGDDFWAEEAKLTVSDAAAFDFFGRSVSVSGATALIGAYRDDPGGSAYVFQRNDNGTPSDTTDDFWTEVAKLTASDVELNDDLGWSVSLSGDTAMVGAHRDNEVCPSDPTCNSGSVYVFEKPVGGWVDMTESAKFFASDAKEDAHFGRSVGISGDTAVIGAPHDNDAGVNSGSAYVFRRDDNGTPSDPSDDSWTEQTKLTASLASPEDWFGWTVSIDGNRAVIGNRGDATGEDGSDPVYILAGLSSDEIDSDTDGVFDVCDKCPGFDDNIDVDGDGAPDACDTCPGQDDNLDFNGDGVPNCIDPSEPHQQAKLIASDAAQGDRFGHSVGISGDTAVIGAMWDNDAGADSGSAYVFRRDDNGTPADSSDDTWYEEAKLTASDAASEDFFGRSVAVSGDIALIGAYGNDDAGDRSGSAYVYRRNDNGTPFDATDDFWTEEAKLTASNALKMDAFGYYVSLSQDTAVIGAPGTCAYVFRRDDNGTPIDLTDDFWLEEGKLTASDAVEGDSFGYSVSIWCNTILIGAWRNDDAGNASGSAYLFEKPIGGWTDMTETTKLTASDAAPGDAFGFSVSISENAAVIGSRNGRGAAYVFRRNCGIWTQEAKLVRPGFAPYQGFGNAVAISGDVVLVGEGGGSPTWPGSVHLFLYDGGTWNHHAKLIVADQDLVDDFGDDDFGGAVAISGNTAVVGEQQDDGVGRDSGSAYMFVDVSRPLASAPISEGTIVFAALLMAGGAVVIRRHQRHDPLAPGDGVLQCQASK